MAKTVALADPQSKLARVLAARGYKVVGLQEAQRFRAHVDAILFAGHQPETAELAVGWVDSGFGNAWPAVDDLPGAIMLNIGGHNPEAVVAELEYRLQHRGWRW